MTVRRVAIYVMLAALAHSPTWAGERQAAALVRDGIRSFQQGDYEAASKSFSEADVTLPENRTIQFNQGCARAAQGDLDKAREQFQDAALAKNSSLSAAALYNLGNLAAEQARALFGDHPEQAQENVRQEGVQLLAQAIARYRDCLKANPDHAEARHNLEVIRLWLKQMQAIWQEMDRKKQRDEMDLLQFLQLIETRQLQLRAATRVLNQEPDSPKKRQLVGQTESAQRTLVDEIDPLKQKIEQSLKPQTATNAPQTAGPQPANEQLEQALDQLAGMADAAGRAMGKAADNIGTYSFDLAVTTQSDALDHLNDIYLALAPFQNVLQKATQTQQGVVDQSTALSQQGNGSVPQAPLPPLDELAANQDRVSQWSDALPAKARQALEQLGSATSAPNTGQDPTAPTPDPAKLKQAIERAIELAPKASTLAGMAADLIRKPDLKEALPKEEEALKILKEMAGNLPNQDQQQQDQNQDRQQNQQGNQNEQQKSSDEQRGEEQQEQEMNQRQAETVLRKARERQQQHRQQQAQLRGLLGGRIPVDKDW